MPKNAEFLIYAYGIAVTVISVFYGRIVLKLRSVNRKLEEFVNREAS